MGDTTGSILVNLVDGTRQPLSSNVKWSARIFDGRSPSEWQETDVEGIGSAELIKGLTYFDNLFDNYTVIISTKGYQGAAWKPVNILPAKPVVLDLMLIPDDAHVNFSTAGWQTVNSVRPRFGQIISAGIADAADRYANLMDTSRRASCWPACLTCSPLCPKSRWRAASARSTTTGSRFGTTRSFRWRRIDFSHTWSRPLSAMLCSRPRSERLPRKKTLASSIRAQHSATSRRNSM